MLNTLVKLNVIIDREPPDILLFLHSLENLSKITLKITVRDQLLSCKAVVCPKDFSVLAKSTCNLKLDIEESTLIKLLKPPLNKNIFSVTLCICFVNDSRKICKIIP